MLQLHAFRPPHPVEIPECSLRATALAGLARARLGSIYDENPPCDPKAGVADQFCGACRFYLLKDHLRGLPGVTQHRGHFLQVCNE